MKFLETFHIHSPSPHLFPLHLFNILGLHTHTCIYMWVHTHMYRHLFLDKRILFLKIFLNCIYDHPLVQEFSVSNFLLSHTREHIYDSFFNFMSTKLWSLSRFKFFKIKSQMIELQGCFLNFLYSILFLQMMKIDCKRD